MLKTVVLLNIFVDFCDTFFSGFFNEQSLFRTVDIFCNIRNVLLSLLISLMHPY